MNYYAVLPNYRPVTPQPLNLSYAQPQHPFPSAFTPTPSILLILSQGLRFSLQQYSASFGQQKAGKELEDKTGGVSVSQQGVKGKMELEQEEKLQKTSHFKMEHEVGKQNIGLVERQGDKHSHNEAQSFTHDEIASENIIYQPPKEKSNSYIPRKKDNSRNRKQSFQVVVPEVDLLETVGLDGLAMDRQELLRKKESLMMRQVEGWSEKGKNRRDRREVRMLN